MKIKVTCPWPWCDGYQVVDTSDLDFLIETLIAFKHTHHACKPKALVEAVGEEKP